VTTSDSTCFLVCRDPFININCQLRADKHSHSSLGTLFWLNAGVEEFLPIAQFYMFRATKLCLVEEMPTTTKDLRLALFTSSCSFAVSEVMF